MRFAALAILFFLPSAHAVEIDFAQRPVDLDGKFYKDCAKPNPKKDDGCDEWIEHTIGLLAYSGLDRPVEDSNLKGLALSLEQARRAVLARKVYPGKNEKHVVDLSAAEITMVMDALSRLQLRPVEILWVTEILDPTRLKDLNK